MALKGSLTTGTSEGRSVTLNWTASQSIENNTSTVSWSLVGSGSASGWVMVSEIRVNINGSQVFYRDTSNHTECYNGTTLCSGKTTISHNTDGSKSFTISIGAGIYGWAINRTAESTFTLDVIPRASSVSMPTGTMGTASTITVTKASTAFSHTITFKFGSATGTICTKSTSTSVSWTPSKDLANQVTKSTSGTGTLTCDTYNGTTKVGTKTFTFTLNVSSDAVPSVTSFTAERVDNTVPSAWGIYVQTKSQCKLTAVGAGSYGSTISSYSIKQGSTVLASSASVTTPVLSTSGTVKFTVTVTDSRGRTASKDVSISVVSYTAPTITSMLSQRCNSNGVLQDDGIYVKAQCSFTFASCSGKNTVTAKVRYRKSGTSTWSSATTISASGTPAVIGGGTISPDNVYDIQFEVADAFGRRYSTDVVSSSFSTIDLKKGGKGIAFGKVSETDNLFDCNMDVKFRQSIMVGDDTVVDHVVEQGTSGIWNYRKWSSGLAECWGVYTASGVNIAKNHYSGFYYSDQITVPYPFTFASAPSCVVSGGTSTYISFSTMFGNNMTTGARFNTACLASGATSVSITVHIHATGRWK